MSLLLQSALIYCIICFPECFWFVLIDTLRFQNREKVFCHCIVVRITLA